jgi:hypothetical protein
MVEFLDVVVIRYIDIKGDLSAMGCQQHAQIRIAQLAFVSRRAPTRRIERSGARSDF